MLCLSAATGSDLKSFSKLPNGESIESGNSLKILGFHFGCLPNASKQVEAMIKKFYSRLWLLRHLRKSNVPNLFKTMVRPVLEFAARLSTRY